MKPELFSFLKELEDLLDRHKVELFYTINDDGIHVAHGSIYDSDYASVWIGFNRPDDLSELKSIIDAEEKQEARRLASEKRHKEAEDNEERMQS